MAIVNQPTNPAPVGFLAEKALNLRRLMLRQAAGKGQGYLGQAFGIADFLSAMFFSELRYDPKRPDWADRDRFLLSTGHYSIALWAVLAEAGYIGKELLPTYGADESPLEMSTIEGRVPGVEMTGGSLGHGLGIAAGAALAARLSNRHYRTFCLMSDGEMQEGSVWEAATFAATLALQNLAVFVDCNGIQADGPMVVRIEPVADKWRAFGWATIEVNGNDMAQLVGALQWIRGGGNAPKAVILRTKPGRGIALLEARENAHFINIASDEWESLARALEQENA